METLTTTEQLLNMKLHECTTLVTSSNSRVEVFRVPNGWIYNFYGAFTSSCFVPEYGEKVL